MLEADVWLQLKIQVFIIRSLVKPMILIFPLSFLPSEDNKTTRMQVVTMSAIIEQDLMIQMMTIVITFIFSKIAFEKKAGIQKHELLWKILLP